MPRIIPHHACDLFIPLRKASGDFASSKLRCSFSDIPEADLANAFLHGLKSVVSCEEDEFTQKPNGKDNQGQTYQYAQQQSQNQQKRKN